MTNLNFKDYSLFFIHTVQHNIVSFYDQQDKIDISKFFAQGSGLKLLVREIYVILLFFLFCIRQNQLNTWVRKHNGIKFDICILSNILCIFA